MELTPTSFVRIEGQTVKVNANGLAEAKLALKELRLKKKEFALLKRALNLRAKEIRAGYTQEVRTRGHMLRGSGTLGKVIRLGQTWSRDARRRQLSTDLAPVQQQQQSIETMMLVIDSAINQVEASMLKMGK